MSSFHISQIMYNAGVGNWQTAEDKTLDPATHCTYLIMLFTIIVLLLIGIIYLI